MLGLLLPKFVLDAMTNPFQISSNATISREVGDVVILFCDIADFDDIVRKHEDKIVFILDKIIKRFDELCVLHGVQKIETVGKTYMAAGGLKQVEDSLPPDSKVIKPAARMLNLAKDMMDYIKEFDGLKLKIGIHVGKPVMGVIGYHKPQFSLIGDAVNTTSRHCTTGEKGHIMLSQSAFDEIEDIESLVRGYKLEVVDTEMKGKGIVKVYHIYPANMLFNQKLRNILDRGNKQYLTQDQARQIHILTRAANKTAEKDGADLDAPEEGGFFSVILKTRPNLRAARKLLRLSGSRMSSSWGTLNNLNDISGPNTPRAPQRRSSGSRPSTFFRDKPGSKTMIEIAPGTGLQKETFLVDESMFELPEDEKVDDETEKLLPTKTLGFRNSQLDLVRKFKTTMKKSNKQNLRIFFAILCCDYILQIVLYSTLGDKIAGSRSSSRTTSIILDSISAFILVLATCSTPKLYTRSGSSIFLTTYIFLPVLTSAKLIVFEGFLNMYQNTVVTLKIYLILGCCIQSSVLSFKKCVFYYFYCLVVFYAFFCYQFGRFNYTYSSLSSPTHSKSLLAYLIFFTLSGFFVLLNNYIHLRSEVLAFNNVNLDASTVVKIRGFVDRLLPKHIQENIGSDELVGETAENVTLLFADIVGFTAYSSGKTPLEVVNMLSQLFTAFDKECNRLNLYKVYTIGDCYVVMSFLDKNNRISPEKECVAVIELAFKMIEIIARVREEIKFDGLHMRIGVHTGKIIGGLVGTGIIRYDMFGQDVLIANKMESSGKSDALHISEATKQMLDKSDSWNKYHAERDDDVEIKALQKKVPAYFLEKRTKPKDKEDIQELK